MTVREKLAVHRDEILALAEKYGAENVRIFGSVARGEDSLASDIDLLVHMREGSSYFDLVDLWLDLQDMMQCKVDVVTDGGLSPYIGPYILKEARPL